MTDKPKKPTTLRVLPSGKRLADVAELVNLMSVLLSTLFVHLITERPQFRDDFLETLRQGLELDAKGITTLSEDLRRAYRNAIEVIEDISR
jgi:hypothetical protein